MIIDVIAGARPNFMKVAALFAVQNEFPSLKLRLIHTGQHYDASMSGIFLEQLGLPQPTRHLNVGSASHATQIAEIMKRYENWVTQDRPDFCLVVGDVNSTAACALVCAKERIPVGHIEAGLRSFDRTMPEEINRIVTDGISSFLFVTEEAAIQNLLNEGHKTEEIHQVGNVMIDTLFRMLEKAKPLEYYKQLNLKPQGYAFLTLHRPSNVDNHKVLEEIVENLIWTAQELPVLFSVHPRTRKNLESSGLLRKINNHKRLILTEPLGYLESLSVFSNAKAVITDSGGLQEETTALKIPCLTLRNNTERPVTIEQGTNTLIKEDWNLYQNCIKRILEQNYLTDRENIPFWDGRTGLRILNILTKL